MAAPALHVPDRFLAFAFGAGDLLIELDQALNILFVDGAEALINPAAGPVPKGMPFQALFSDDGWGELSILQTMQKRSSFRFGPITLPVGVQADKRRRFLIFINKVLGENRLFVTLSLESRLVQSPEIKPAAEKDDVQVDAFVDRVETLLEAHSGDENGPKMTIVEAMAENLPPAAHAAVMKGLAKHSLDGVTATQFNDGQFAVLHSGDEAAPSSDDILSDVSELAGVALQGKAIDTQGPGQPPPAVFLHTLKEVLTSDDGQSLDEIYAAYSDTLNGNMEKAEAFARVINEDQFDLLYQPIVRLSSRKIHHLEALTRFQALSGFSNPFETIKFAEEIGAVAEFDLKVLSKVLAAIVQERGRKTPKKIAANVSGYSLNQPRFCDDLIDLLKNSLVRKGDLQIEITESFQIHDLDGLSDVVKDIQSLGFDVYLDDFGAGASGFQYLRVLPVNGVKIDGPYIRDALVDPQAKAFLRAMISLCRELGIKTIAEWIETEDQHDFLCELGADFGQGFLYGAAADLPG